MRRSNSSHEFFIGYPTRFADWFVWKMVLFFLEEIFLQRNNYYINQWWFPFGYVGRYLIAVKEIHAFLCLNPRRRDYFVIPHKLMNTCFQPRKKNRILLRLCQRIFQLIVSLNTTKKVFISNIKKQNLHSKFGTYTCSLSFRIYVRNLM